MIYSQNSQLTTSQLDNTTVIVPLKNIIKANQAYIENISLRKINDFKDTVITQKDKAFQRLLDANNLSHNLNKEYEIIVKANHTKLTKCEEYAGKIEFQNKQILFQNGFLKIGTPLIAVAVGAGGFAIGYYINQLTK